MNTANWLLVAIIVYSLILLYLGRYAYLKEKAAAAEDYFHAGRRGSILNVIVYSASQSGAITLVSELESSVLHGISVIWYGIGVLCMTLLIAGWVITPLRKKQVITISGYLGDHFGEPVRAVSGAVIGLFMPLFSLATVVATAQILRVLYAVPAWETVALCSLVLLAYVLFGGMLSISLTGIVNTFTMYLGLAIMAGAAFYFNGFHKLFTALPASYYNPLGVGVPLILVWLGTWVVNALLAQTQLQMLLTSKDERVGRRGVYLSLIPLGFVTIMAPLAGLGLRLLFPHESDGFVATALLIKDRLPLWASIVVVLGIWCTSLIWAGSNQFSGAVSLGRDLGKAIGLSLNHGQEKLYTQISLFVVTFILIILGTLRPSDSAWWSVFGFAVRNAALVSLPLAALVWMAMSARAGYCSMIMGGVSAFVWYALNSFSTTRFYLGIHPMWIGLSLALVAPVLWMTMESLLGKQVSLVWNKRPPYQYIISGTLLLLGGYIIGELRWLLVQGIIGALAFVWSVLFFFLGTLTVVKAEPSTAEARP